MLAINVLDVEDAEYETDFNRYLGRFAAASSVMFTSIAHTKYQLLFSGITRNMRRFYTLVLFVLFPLSAMLGTFHVLKAAHPDVHYEYPKTENATSMVIPTLYWQSMDRQDHRSLIWLAWLSPTLILLVLVIFASCVLATKYGPPSTAERLRRIYMWLYDNDHCQIVMAVYFSFTYMTISLTLVLTKIGEWTGHDMRWARFISAPALYIFALIYCEIAFPVAAVWYVVEAYLKRHSSVSDSCFFMPCSPYSIWDSDQLLALLLGCVAGLVVEGPLVWSLVKKKWVANRVFTQEMERRFRALQGRTVDAGGTDQVVREPEEGMEL
ncbi:hypothetical protein LTS18_002749 [Coniosporium uncinatum]|uniref:Uncharacterized protein n=1 Tax=Coniosporium uncinatum TaxID=93489 RepID=A0ACC3DUC1_9PEZI|nr:hypothetical protein LTS18_002749 [Coniosporium uncinatum]